MWEKPYPSESAGFYAPSAECCRQHPPEMQLSPAAPGLPAGRGCFCSLESPLDGGTKSTSTKRPWTAIPAWKIPGSGEIPQEGPDGIKPIRLSPHHSVDVTEDAAVRALAVGRNRGGEGILQERNIDSTCSGETETWSIPPPKPLKITQE